jgi:hypothetical protein
MKPVITKKKPLQKDQKAHGHTLFFYFKGKVVILLCFKKQKDINTLPY